MSELKKLHPTAAIFKGDPRLPKQQIDEWYQWVLAEVKGAYARPHLYGSDAGHCARRNVFLANNEDMPSDVTAVSKAYMALGVAYEDLLAKNLARQGRLVGQGIRIPLLPEVKISGILDLLVFDPDDELAIIEVKTCGKLPDVPKPTHLAQAQIYAAVTGVEKVWLSYFSRNVQLVYGEGLSVRSFAVDTSAEALAKRIEVALISQSAIQKNRVPPVPATFRKHTECHVCEFRDHFCWMPRPGLLEAGATPQPLPLNLKDMSVEDSINLSKKVEVKAKEVVDGRSTRKMNFLRAVLDMIDTTHEIYPLVEKEYEKSILSIL